MDKITLQKLFIERLKKTYGSEKQIYSFLPRLITSVSNRELKEVLKDHLELTGKHIVRLFEVFNHFADVRPSSEHCSTIEGLIREGEYVLQVMDYSSVRDAEIISVCQKLGHFRIAMYGTLVTYARKLGNAHHADLLQLVLDEAYEVDNKLDKLAEEVLVFTAG